MQSWEASRHKALASKKTKLKIPSPNHSPRNSIFSNFETTQLTTEERLLLHGARLGDTALLSKIISKAEKSPDHHCINYNCVDFMGRNIMHLAVDSENFETVDLLLKKCNAECIEEGLLHAIGKCDLHMVRFIVDNSSALEKQKARFSGGGGGGCGSSDDDAFFRTEEKYQFSPDIKPLILAAHKNDAEIIQIFLSRGDSIDRPHAIQCKCDDCQRKQDTDSLKRSRSRLNAYKALASPAYMALSTPDPFTATFELRQEIQQVAQVEKEFQKEYLSLLEQCMQFACELMDLCRGTQEVEAVLAEECSGGVKDPLVRLRLAIEYGEKRFTAHPNCQQYLTSIWYTKEMSFLLTLSTTRKIALSLLTIPILPIACIVYVINPNWYPFSVLKCPVSKFITHTSSYVVFLFVLIVATFGFEDDEFYEEDWKNDIRKRLRPFKSVATTVQLMILSYVLGILCKACKQIYRYGFGEYFHQFYNIMDFSVLSLYLASFTLKIVAFQLVAKSDEFFNATSRIQLAFQNNDQIAVKEILNEIDISITTEAYFLKASRFQWSPTDPEIISDILFAMANILSFARTTYIMPSHELLGPLQISLGRMCGDIARFFVLFLLVLFAFMVGLTNMYKYYGTQVNVNTGRAAMESFKALPETVHTLIFSIFGLIPLDQLKIDQPNKVPNTLLPNSNISTFLVDRVGFIMFAVYMVAVSIVLVNILIAMMSHSFEAIQIDTDVEWKFARTKLWLSYIDESSTLPVPFNVLPTWKTIKDFINYFRNKCRKKDNDIDLKSYDFTKRRQHVTLPEIDLAQLVVPSFRRTTYAEIVQRLIRRYLFKLEDEQAEKFESYNLERTNSGGYGPGGGGSGGGRIFADDKKVKRITKQYELNNERKLIKSGEISSPRRKMSKRCQSPRDHMKVGNYLKIDNAQRL